MCENMFVTNNWGKNIKKVMGCGNISFYPDNVFFTGTEVSMNFKGPFFLVSVLSLQLSHFSPFDVKLYSCEMCCLDMAASQNLITHVKSPWVKTSCVTSGDHIMFYFWTALAVASLLDNKWPNLFLIHYSFINIKFILYTKDLFGSFKISVLSNKGKR